MEFWAVVEAISYVVAGASIIVKMTPTTRDDKFLGKIQKLLEIISLNKRN